MIAGSSKDVATLASAMADAAQKVYDEWDQDSDGIDETLGAGGICDLVADAMSTVVRDNLKVIATTQYDEYDTHTRSVVRLSDGVFQIDIPASVYEIGYGYVWKKRDGVTISADDVVIHRLDPDPARFADYVTDFDPEDDEPTIVGTHTP